jgi:ABC-2 type transport system ATP-binding protein
MLIAEGLAKRYGAVRALDGFDLSVGPGEVTGLIGHNGAGKTTFVEIVTGLVRPDAGRVTLGGAFGVAPQEPALYPSATLAENLRLFGALAGLRRPALRRAVSAVADELMLGGGVLDRPTGLLSGGQRRRAQAAVALIADPPLLLLDEPTAGADPETRTALLDAVRRRAAAGTAVLYTTHYLPELADLGATLAVARAGRIVARGTREALTEGLPGELRLRLADPAQRAHIPSAIARRTREAAGELRITSHDAPADLAALLAAGCVPATVDMRRPDLDDLYNALALTAQDTAGEASRDAA